MKFYIYRNLHTKTFSVRFDGLVIEHPTLFVGTGVIFKVNQGGRDRVIREKRKNVHAYVVVNDYAAFSGNSGRHFIEKIKNMNEVTYNPYKYDTFVVKKTSKPIFNAEFVIGYNNKIYVK